MQQEACPKCGSVTERLSLTKVAVVDGKPQVVYTCCRSPELGPDPVVQLIEILVADNAKGKKESQSFQDKTKNLEEQISRNRIEAHNQFVEETKRRDTELATKLAELRGEHRLAMASAKTQWDTDHAEQRLKSDAMALSIESMEEIHEATLAELAATKKAADEQSKHAEGLHAEVARLNAIVAATADLLKKDQPAASVATTAASTEDAGDVTDEHPVVLIKECSMCEQPAKFHLEVHRKDGTTVTIDMCEKIRDLHCEEVHTYLQTWLIDPPKDLAATRRLFTGEAAEPEADKDDDTTNDNVPDENILGESDDTGFVSDEDGNGAGFEAHAQIAEGALS